MKEAFETYEKVLDKYPEAPAAERVGVFMNEATLCSQNPMLIDRAKQLYTKIKTEFPQTRAAMEADRRLAELARKPGLPTPSQR